MTVDELSRQVDEVKDGVLRGEARTEDLSNRITEINTVTVRTETMLRAFIERTGDEREALFRFHKEHEGRLAIIESTYVPENRCGEHRKEETTRIERDNLRIGQTEERLSKLEIQVARWMGMAVVLSALVGIVVNLVGRWIWH